MRIYRRVMLEVLDMTLAEVTQVLCNLKESESWVNATINYGVSEESFYRKEICKAFEFLNEQSMWTFDYDSNFALYITFRNEEDAVLCKLECLLDI